MSRWKVVVPVVVAALLATVWVGSALSAERASARAAAGRGGGGGRRDPEQMRQRYLERIKEALGPTKEEWKALEPKVGKVWSRSRELTGAIGMRALFRRGPRPEEGPPGAEEPPKLSELEEAVQGLQTALEDQETKPPQIRKKLAAVREARKKAEQELAKAQKELREAVNLRQEAQLVLMGLLD